MKSNTRSRTTPKTDRATPGTKPGPTFISVIPFLGGGKGHMLSYNLAVSRAVRISGWNFAAALPEEENLPGLPDNWIAALKTGSLESPGFRKFLLFPLVLDVIRCARSLSGFFNKLNTDHTNQTIVFVERFNPYQLASIILSLYQINRDNLRLWLLYRHRPDANVRRKYLYLFLTNSARRLLDDRLCLLTDSSLLQKSLATFFRVPVEVVPIPHTLPQKAQHRPKRSANVVCWWAGPPREAKGWTAIRKLMSFTGPMAQKVEVVAARASDLTAIASGVGLRLIDDVLTPSAYNKQLLGSDIMLLPYEAHFYREETSGIFVESVVAGKIPVVSDHTWMASELRSHDLGELIADWNSPALPSFLVSMARNKVVQRKLSFMRREYTRFHNEESYSAVIQHLFHRQATSP